MIIEGYIDCRTLETLVCTKLSEMGIKENSYPINPFHIIGNEGILLQEMPFDNSNIKGMLVHGPNVSGILINSNRSIESKRFIAMHELAHDWFHPHESKTICLDENIDCRKGIEWQANNAAAYALMPTNLVREIFYFCKGDIDYMKDFFGVSRDAMTYRINEIKLHPPVTYASTMDHNDLRLLDLETRWLYGNL